MASDRPSLDAARSALVLALAVAQIVTSFSPDLFGFAETVASRVKPLEHSLLPIAYAFAIWGVIYAGNLVFAVWQALPTNRSHPLARQIGWLAAGMYAINAAWQVWVPLFGADWISSLLLAAELALGMAALLRIRGARPLGRAETWLVAAPVGLLTGWITAAAFVNFSTSVIQDGSWLFDPRHVPAAAALLAATIAFAALAVNATRSAAQAAGILWALHGIVVANLVRAPEPLIVWVAAAGVPAVILGWWLGGRPYPRAASGRPA